MHKKVHVLRHVHKGPKLKAMPPHGAVDGFREQ